MLDFIPPTIEYTEAVHQRDMEIAEKHRQIRECQKTQRFSLLQRFRQFITRWTDKPDQSEPDQALIVETELRQLSQS